MLQKIAGNKHNSAISLHDSSTNISIDLLEQAPFKHRTGSVNLWEKAKHDLTPNHVMVLINKKYENFPIFPPEISSSRQTYFVQEHGGYIGNLSLQRYKMYFIQCSIFFCFHFMETDKAMRA